MLPFVHHPTLLSSISKLDCPSEGEKKCKKQKTLELTLEIVATTSVFHAAHSHRINYVWMQPPYFSTGTEEKVRRKEKKQQHKKQSKPKHQQITDLPIRTGLKSQTSSAIMTNYWRPPM